MKRKETKTKQKRLKLSPFSPKTPSSSSFLPRAHHHPLQLFSTTKLTGNTMESEQMISSTSGNMEASLKAPNTGEKEPQA